jgi:hypothetical protein
MSAKLRKMLKMPVVTDILSLPVAGAADPAGTG